MPCLVHPTLPNALCSYVHHCAHCALHNALSTMLDNNCTQHSLHPVLCYLHNDVQKHDIGSQQMCNCAWYLQKTNITLLFNISKCNTCLDIICWLRLTVMLCWKRNSKEKETLVDLSVQFDFVKTFQSELDKTLNFRAGTFSLSWPTLLKLHCNTTYNTCKISNNKDLNFINCLASQEK